jgi:riboflavin kinase
MSYLALATDRFDEVVEFYGDALGFPIVERWDRLNGRGLRFDLGGMRLEVLDNRRERRPLELGLAADRIHVVIEVDDVDTTWAQIDAVAPEPETTSWGARVFQLRDPDGIAVTFLQWLENSRPAAGSLRGRVSGGSGKGSLFTRLEWARAQFIERLGVDPFPGTFNLVLEDDESKAAWCELRSMPGIPIENPGNASNDCDGRCYRVTVDGWIRAAVVVPEVPGYPDDKIEIIAPIGLRDILGKSDGDVVVLEFMEIVVPPQAASGSG